MWYYPVPVRYCQGPTHGISVSIRVPGGVQDGVHMGSQEVSRTVYIWGPRNSGITGPRNSGITGPRDSGITGPRTVYIGPNSAKYGPNSAK